MNTSRVLLLLVLISCCALYAADARRYGKLSRKKLPLSKPRIPQPRKIVLIKKPIFRQHLGGRRIITSKPIFKPVHKIPFYPIHKYRPIFESPFVCRRVRKCSPYQAWNQKQCRCICKQVLVRRKKYYFARYGRDVADETEEVVDDTELMEDESDEVVERMERGLRRKYRLRFRFVIRKLRGSKCPRGSRFKFPRTSRCRCY